jgi:hypothetical protein
MIPMSNKKNNKVSPARKFKRVNIDAGRGAEVEIDAYTTENGKYPIAIVTIDDGTHDGRPWGCGGSTTLESSSGATLREIADALLEAADYLDKMNAANDAKVKAKLAKRKANANA